MIELTVKGAVSEKLDDCSCCRISAVASVLPLPLTPTPHLIGKSDTGVNDDS